MERDRLLWIISPEGKEEFKQRVDETITYADLLREFTSAKPTVEQLIELIPAIKPRYIFSEQKCLTPTQALLDCLFNEGTPNKCTPVGRR